MFWRIVRPRFWIADRQVRRLDKRVLLLGVLLLGFGGQWVYDRLAPYLVDLATTTDAPLLVANMLLSGIYLFLLVGMLGLDDLLQQLFLSPEMELLFVAPIPLRTLFAVKLWQGSRVVLWPALAFAVVLLGFGAARGVPPVYYPLMVVLVVGVALLVTAALITFVLLLARRLPPRRVHAWLPLGLALLPAALAFSYNPVMGWLTGQTVWLNRIALALTHPVRLLPLVGGTAVLALAFSVAAYRTFAASFVLGWNQLQSVPVTVKEEPGAETAVPAPIALSHSWLNRLPAPLRYFAPKEWRMLRRSPQRLTGLLTAFLPIAIIFLPLLLSDRRRDPAWQPFFFWLLLVIALAFAYVTILNETLPALPREGRRLALLRLAPVKTAVWLRHKFWGLPWPLVLGVWGLVLLVLALLWRMAVWQVVVIAAALGWTLLLTAAFFYALGALFGPLTGTDDDAKVPGLATLLALGGYILLALLTLATAIWLVALWQPQSATVAVLRPFAASTVLGWLLTPSPIAGWVLLAGQGTAGALILVLWRLARRRLANWEEG